MARTPQEAVCPGDPDESEDLEDLGPLAALSRDERRRLRAIRHQTPAAMAVPVSLLFAPPVDAAPAPQPSASDAAPASRSSSASDAAPASRQSPSRPTPLVATQGRVAQE
eukprot:4703748-Amphidinium_carterae.1